MIDLSKLIRYVESAEEASTDSRKMAERDRDYYDNKQLTETEVKALEKRGQPPIVINRVKRKIDFLLGTEMKQRQMPKAFPRTPQHEDDANSVTDALRYIADKNRFNTVRSGVWGNKLIEGFGGAEVGIDPKTKDITVTKIPWDRLIVDPHSREPDYSDAKYMGYLLWMDKEDAEERWADRKAFLETTGQDSDTHDDKPSYAVWSDNQRQRVKVCQMYFKVGDEWQCAIFTKGGYLKDPQVSPYLDYSDDKEGKPENPIKLTSAYVDRENNRYGVIREMIGPQDEINKRRSKALHLISVRQIKAEKGAVDDVEKTRKELARPDGYIEHNPGTELEVLDTGDMAASQFSLLQEAKQEIDLMGPNASMQGKDSKAPSGRAILASQQGGYIELEPMMDGLRQWQREIYHATWNRVRQYWTEEKWIRVTDDEKNLKWVGLNQPVTVRDQLMEQHPEQAQQIQQDPNPQLDQVVEVRNQVSEIDVDIVIEEAPDIVTLQAEQFEELAKLSGAGGIPPDMLVEMSSLRTETKEKVLERMRGNPEQAAEQAQKDAQKQETMFSLEAETMATDIEKTQAETEQIRRTPPQGYMN